MTDSSIYYQKHAKEFFKSTVELDISHLYRSFEEHLPLNARILDVGCGAGRDLKYFRSIGYSPLGIDASSNLVELARKFSGCTVHCMNFEDINWKEKFDGIWCCASLLHTTQSKLPQVFSLLSHALAPRGVIYLSFKYGSSERISNGRHFTDLNEMLLSKFIAHLDNIKLSKIWITPDSRPGRESEDWLNAILVKTNKVVK